MCFEGDDIIISYKSFNFFFGFGIVLCVSAAKFLSMLPLGEFSSDANFPLYCLG